MAKVGVELQPLPLLPLPLPLLPTLVLAPPLAQRSHRLEYKQIHTTPRHAAVTTVVR